MARLNARKAKAAPAAPLTLDEYRAMIMDEYRAMIERERPEGALQLEVVRWLQWAIDPAIVWTAVDHAGKLSARQGADRKARGVRRGQGDLRFVLAGGRSAEIELKSHKGKQSEAQVEWQRRVEAAGALYAVARSLDEVRAILRGWGVGVYG